MRELAAEVRARDQERLLFDFVFRMILAGLVDISSVPLRINKVGASKPKPRAGRLPRLDAEQGNAWTTDPALNIGSPRCSLRRPAAIPRRGALALGGITQYCFRCGLRSFFLMRGRPC